MNQSDLRTSPLAMRLARDWSPSDADIRKAILAMGPHFAAATTRVPTGIVKWGDDKIKRPLDAVAATYYPGQFMCINPATGYEVAAADTDGLIFDGIVVDTVNVFMNSGDAAGSRTITVERPFRFSAVLSTTPVITDIGKLLYIVDDQTLGYTSSNGVFAGWVDQVAPPGLGPNAVLVLPPWSTYGTGVPRQQALIPITASGAVDPHTSASYVITKAGIAVLTLAAPTAGIDDGKIITITSSTAYAHTLTATGLFNTGSANVNEATFAAYAGAGLTLQAYNGFWNILSSTGITFS
ncbi:MAG TPA: hypothetical protein VGP68_08075 [Gemmataceae bacterium]|nr:hypothetical protein [Gemmataceae bacterium]